MPRNTGRRLVIAVVCFGVVAAVIGAPAGAIGSGDGDADSDGNDRLNTDIRSDDTKTGDQHDRQSRWSTHTERQQHNETADEDDHAADRIVEKITSPGEHTGEVEDDASEDPLVTDEVAAAIEGPMDILQSEVTPPEGAVAPEAWATHRLISAYGVGIDIQLPVPDADNDPEFTDADPRDTIATPTALGQTHGMDTGSMGLDDTDDGLQSSNGDEKPVSEDESGFPAPAPPGPGSGAVVGIGAIAAGAVARNTSLIVGLSQGSTGSSSLLASIVDRLRPVFFPFRYSRYDDSDPLEHEARKCVYDIVMQAPGSYLSEVATEAELPLSTTRHHMKILQQEGLVSDAKLRGKRRYYPAYAEGIELAAALNDQATASILHAINRLGAVSVSDLADELGRDPSTISHHLQRLEEDNIITRERDGRSVVSRLSTDARTMFEPDASTPGDDVKETIVGEAD